MKYNTVNKIQTPSMELGCSVSFVIIAYNEASNISQTLHSIVALDGLNTHEIIVVDDGSSDDTREVVAKLARGNPNIKLFSLESNHGRGYARSKGIAEARGELIATIDADIILPADWLNRTRIALHNYDAVGGTPLPDGDVQYIYKRFSLTPRGFPATTPVPGNNGLYRRRVFEIVSFDPDLREGEDSDLNYAMAQQSLSIATVPGLFVRHEESKSFGKSLKWLFETGRGATRQFLTSPGVRQPDIVTGAMIATTALGLAITMSGHFIVGISMPILLLFIASAQHVRTRFVVSVCWWRAGAAILTNCALLVAYFIGRITGLLLLSAKRDTHS